VRFFNIFGADRVGPAWEYHSDGILWHVRSTNVGVVLCEERDHAQKSVTFAALAHSSGKVLWKKKFDGRLWWTGIEAIHDDILFLHGYQNPELPYHQGITAVDLLSGACLWERAEIRFEGVLGDAVVGMTQLDGGERVESLKLRTGEPIHIDELEIGSRRDATEPEDPEFLLPVSIEELGEERPSVASLVRARCVGLKIEGDLQVRVEGNHVAFGYHELVSSAAQPMFRTTLMVLDSMHGTMNYQCILDAATPRLVPALFFIHRQMMFAIQERSTLLAITMETPRV